MTFARGHAGGVAKCAPEKREIFGMRFASLRPDDRDGGIDGASNPDHHQQELFVVVAARMAAGAVRRARFRGADRSGRRSRGPGGAVAAVLVDSGAMPRT